jgi:DNA-binding transcriptional MocR family regulator
MLQPSDIYVLSGVVAAGDGAWTYRELASRLGVAHALVQRALKRGEEAGLYSSESRSVHEPNLEEFVLHGLRFLAPARLGGVVSGVPAAWAASPVSRRVRESGALPPVWPSASGQVRGQALVPLHEAAVGAVEEFPELGELLAIVDSLRAGDVRVRSVASEMLVERLGGVVRNQPR